MKIRTTVNKIRENKKRLAEALQKNLCINVNEKTPLGVIAEKIIEAYPRNYLYRASDDRNTNTIQPGLTYRVTTADGSSGGIGIGTKNSIPDGRPIKVYHNIVDEDKVPNYDKYPANPIQFNGDYAAPDVHLYGDVHVNIEVRRDHPPAEITVNAHDPIHAIWIHDDNSHQSTAGRFTSKFIINGECSEDGVYVMLDVSKNSVIEGLDLNSIKLKKYVRIYNTGYTSLNLDLKDVQRALLYNMPLLTDLTLTNTDNLVTAASMLYQLQALTTPINLHLPNVTSLNQMFRYSSKIPSITLTGLSKVTDASQMCSSASKLTEINLPELPSLTNANSMFYSCASLTTPPITYSESITNVMSMYEYCGFVNAPDFHFPNATVARYLLARCNKMKTVGDITLESATNCMDLLNGCSVLETTGAITLPAATDVSNCFYNCYDITNITDFDAPVATNYHSFVRYCYKLESLSFKTTPKPTTMGLMFGNCYVLPAVPTIDCSLCTSVDNMLQRADAMVDISGFQNLGAGYQTSKAANYSSYTFDATACPKLDHDKTMIFANSLADLATAGVKTQSVKFHADVLLQFSEEDLLIFTNKGWTVS